MDLTYLHIHRASLLTRFALAVTFFFAIGAANFSISYASSKASSHLGPKAQVFTFTGLGGVYVNGANQRFLDRSDRFRSIYNYGLRFGYAWNQFVETELGFEFSPTLNGIVPSRFYHYGVAMIVQKSVTDRLVPYLIGGAGGATFDTDGLNLISRLAVDYGAGVKIFLNRALALRPEFRALTTFSRQHTAFLGTLGLTYYMGSAVASPAVETTPAISAPTTTPRPVVEQPQLIESESEPVVTSIPASMRDTDGDGIMDDVDQCPTQPETFNNYQDDDGCPDEIPEALKEFTGVIAGIRFAFNSPIIDRSSYPILDRAVEAFKHFKDVYILIEGHTDSIGAKEYNIRLSLKRAASVQEYLTFRDIDSHRIAVIGFGFDQPLADNSTEVGRSQNRRIEFKLLTKPKPIS